jgi:hypothetical protein
MMTEALRTFLINPGFLGTWGALVLASLVWVVVDLRARNPEIPSLMSWVWTLTVLYSGPIGLGIYFFSGRKQIAKDSVWRRSLRSVAHCYSGCGGGEVVGIIIAVGLLALANLWVAIITFALAYVAGFALTMGPLMQEGTPARTALKDAFYSETASITVMEIVAIGVDLWLAGEATMGEPLFWASLIFSLTLGLVAAYPVNVVLIRLGVKEGMHDPREMAAH